MHQPRFLQRAVTVSYNNRLKLLGLDRLELRRLRADLVTCYKIINGLLDIPFVTADPLAILGAFLTLPGTKSSTSDSGSERS